MGVFAVAMMACNEPAEDHVAVSVQHTSSMALTATGGRLYVANADADSVSVIDTASRTLEAEIALSDGPRTNDAGDYAPLVMPRALALSPDDKTLYVTGQRSGMVFAIDTETREVAHVVGVGSEPVGVVVSADGAAIYVAVTQDDSVVRLDPELNLVATATVPSQPWALAMWPSEGALVATSFTGAGVTFLDPDTLEVRSTTVIPDTPARGDPRLAHGVVRGLYDVVPRPLADELWVPHLLLGIDTAQPELDFERTVFPSVSLVHAGDTYEETLSIDAADVPGVDGAFADIVSGPHALAFSPDGRTAFVVDTNSEDVLVVGGDHTERSLVRPLPGHMPEGIAISPDDTHAYVDERNTADVVVLDLATRSVDGGPIARLASDPMPADLRLGQHLFYSANSDELPLTRNHWVACASCHLEGRSDGVTWRFEQGPRDTPTNAGGMLGTGFLFRTADRTEVQDYWHTIAVEQGGSIDAVADADLLDALERYVDHAIPFPQPPTTDATLVARGKTLFEDPVVGCTECHRGPLFTDSGSGNTSLDLAGSVLLHDVGTCVSAGDFPDVAHVDVLGDARAACMFDTPSLRGIAASPPYLHDGSAPTIRAVLERTRGTMGDTTKLSGADLDALAEYVRSL